MSLSRAMEATSPPEAAAWQEASDSDDSDVWTPYDSDAEDNVGEDLALASDETSAAPALVSNDSVSRTEMDVALILSDQEHYEHRLLKTEYGPTSDDLPWLSRDDASFTSRLSCFCSSTTCRERRLLIFVCVVNVVCAGPRSAQSGYHCRGISRSSVCSSDFVYSPTSPGYLPRFRFRCSCS